MVLQAQGGMEGQPQDHALMSSAGVHAQVRQLRCSCSLHKPTAAVLYTNQLHEGCKKI